MITRVHLPSDHPLSRIYRRTAVVAGVLLAALGGAGLAGGIPFFASGPDMLMGLAANAPLSLFSLVAGVALLASAAVGGAVPSTSMAVLGGLFLVLGFVHLAVLRTALNVWELHFSNIVFGLVAGVTLLACGLHGRVSGGLAPHNPFVLARRHADSRPATPSDTLRPRTVPGAGPVPGTGAEEQTMLDAELAAWNGVATPHQRRLLHEDAQRRQAEHRRQAHEHYRRAHPSRA